MWIIWKLENYDKCIIIRIWFNLFKIGLEIKWWDCVNVLLGVVVNVVFCYMVIKFNLENLILC